MTWRSVLSVCCFSLFIHLGYTQSTPWDKRVEASVSPQISNRLLLGVNPQTDLGYTESLLEDSFRIADEGQNGVSFSLGILFQRERGRAWKASFGYQRWGFNRVKENNMYRYQPHPDLQIYSHLAEGPVQRLLYQFQQDYFELKVDHFIRLDGVKMQLPKTELYFTYGASLGVLITDRIRIKTQGFSLEEGTEVDVYDYTTSFSESGDLLINKVENPTLNGFVYSSLRAEYQLDEKLRLLCEPNVGISITPNFTGTQTANAIRIGCSLGLVYPVE